MTPRFDITSRVLAAALALAAAVASPAAQAGDAAAEIDAIRAATARYADVKAALADGYVPDPSGHCVSAAAEGLPAELGSMGIHYLHPARLGVTQTAPRVNGAGLHTDFREPAILLYEPQADGSLVLVGVENLVFEKAWRAAGNAGAPVFLDREWDRMADDAATSADEAHGFEPHYDQHVWFRGASEGALQPFNAAVTCEHAPRGH